MLNSISTIKECLNEIYEEETSCNEGSLNMHYDYIINELNKIETILYKFIASSILYSEKGD